MRQTIDHRERAYAPRRLRREAAADWVKLGLMPRGKMARGCRVWDLFQPAAIETVAELTAPQPFPPREIAPMLPFSLERSIVRAILLILVHEGRGVVEDELSKRRYRLAGVGA